MVSNNLLALRYPMKENVNQSLSAMIDDECESFEVRRTLEQLDADGLKTWSRYQAVSASLEGEKVYNLDISGRVMQALDAEPAILAPKQKNDFLTKPFASVAIAASVTAMVIFGVQSFQSPFGSQNQLSQDSGIVLPAPQATNSAFMPAQFGSLPQQTLALNKADVIRLDASADKYIQQHQTMGTLSGQEWAASWVPEGYRPLSHDVSSDAEVLRFTDGDAIISIFVESGAKAQQAEGVVHSGDTVALSKHKGQQLVTVVGNMPLLVADRIANSVRPIE